MEDDLKIVVITLFFLLNILGFLLIGYDKKQAKSKGWRIAERKIFTMAIVGAALGVYLGMKIFRHKTKHNSFVYGIPILLVINAIMFYYAYQLIW